MSKIQIILQILSLIFSMSLCYCKDAQTKYHPGGPYYYGGFANYKIPFQPIEELTLAEAKLRESYYEAYFDSNGRIISFTKYLKGEKAFNDKYIYGATGLLERREITKNADGLTIQYFNEKGEIIKENILKR